LRIYLEKTVEGNSSSVGHGIKVLQLISPELVKGSSVKALVTKVIQRANEYVNLRDEENIKAENG
jgi:hypothetical protein